MTRLTVLLISFVLFAIAEAASANMFVFARFRPRNNQMGSTETERRTVKRNAANVRPLPPSIPVCESKIVENYQPKSGVDASGAFVEVEQSALREFRATYVECADVLRGPCYGIDTAFFSSECATVYTLRQASVRPQGAATAFAEGLIKVPIACECRLRKKLFLRA